MKKLYCAISLLGLLIVYSKQVNAQSIPHLGVRLGANFSAITNFNAYIITNSTNAHTTEDRRTGFIGGLYGQFMISKRHFSVQPEVLYSQKGEVYDLYQQGHHTRVKFSLGYLEVPVMFKYNILPSALVQPSIYLGPYVGFKLHAKLKAVSGASSIKKSVDSSVQNVDVGFATGVGLGYGRYHLGFRFTFGLKGIMLGSFTNEPRNSVLSVVAGIDI